MKDSVLHISKHSNSIVLKILNERMKKIHYICLILLVLYKKILRKSTYDLK